MINDDRTIADVRRIVEEYLDDAWREGFVRANGFDAMQREMLLQFERESAADHIRKTLEENWLTSLPLPLQLTADDIDDAVFRWLLDATDDFDTRLARFDRFLDENASFLRRSQAFSIGTGFFVPHDARSGVSSQPTLWTSANGFSVQLVGSIALGEEHDVLSSESAYPMWVRAKRELYARVSGRCTNYSLLRFKDETQTMLQSMLVLLQELLLFKSSLIKSRTAVMSNPMLLLDVWSQDMRDFFGQVFAAYYSRSTKKDSIDRRLRNAVHLLVQAGGQSHFAVSMSLSVAAVEAMLCSQGDDLSISSQMADNVATLLEPEGKSRPAAVAFVKKLYDVRSKTLHGTLLEHEAKYLRDARLLATAVLYAFLERRQFQRRMGHDSEKPDDLLKELKYAKYCDGEVPGVSPCPIRSLWREPANERSVKDK